jgi:hypothetical protein
MKRIFTLLFLIPLTAAFGQIEGTWKLAAEAGALAVGPSLGNLSWFQSTAADVDTRACLFDDEYVFNADGTFQNILGAETWLEGWQGAAESCGAPVAPHDGSGSFTWTENAGTVTVNGTGAYLGLAKVHNGGELASPGDAVASITYNYTLSGDGNRMTLDINFGGGVWQFILDKETGAPPVETSVEGAWRLKPDAGALAVGPSASDLSWFQSTVEDVETRSCLFDDFYVFNEDGTFENVLQSETWLEVWQGVDDGCGTPVAPHDGTGAYTWTYDDVSNKVTVIGEGGYLGLSKVHNNGELANPSEVVGAITYDISFSVDGETMTAQVDFGGGVWQFVLVKDELPVAGLIEESLNVSVAPNPFTSNIDIRSDENMESIEVIDITGKVVHSLNTDGKSASIDLSGLVNGAYLVVIHSNNSVSTKRIIKN